jgi:hypothetical protein
MLSSIICFFLEDFSMNSSISIFVKLFFKCFYIRCSLSYLKLLDLDSETYPITDFLNKSSKKSFSNTKLSLPSFLMRHLSWFNSSYKSFGLLDYWSIWDLTNTYWYRERTELFKEWLSLNSGVYLWLLDSKLHGSSSF